MTYVPNPNPAIMEVAKALARIATVMEERWEVEKSTTMREALDVMTAGITKLERDSLSNPIIAAAIEQALTAPVESFHRRKRSSEKIG